MIPRALCGPVLAMARPSRPASETRAVREAAAIVATEMPSASPPAIAREIARRVAEATIADIEHDDPVSLALAALGQTLMPSPITTLATCPEIDTASIFVEWRITRLRGRSGRYLAAWEQAVEKTAIIAELEDKLAHRYLRHIRGVAERGR
jgi:hypothetical protein